MANHITNDLGKTVIAVGAPYSIARVEVQYPLLISQLRRLDHLDAITVLHQQGFRGLERQSLMIASNHELSFVLKKRSN